MMLRLGQLRYVVLPTTREGMHAAPNDAVRSAVAVPDRRTSLVSGREMNTRLLVCDPVPVGLLSSVFSLTLLAVKPSVSAAPPVSPPSVPAVAGSVAARRYTSTFLVPSIGQVV